MYRRLAALGLVLLFQAVGTAVAPVYAEPLPGPTTWIETLMPMSPRPSVP